MKRLGTVPVPSADRMKVELAELGIRKEQLLTEYRSVQRTEKEYETIKQNVDMLLSQPDRQEQQRHELE